MSLNSFARRKTAPLLAAALVASLLALANVGQGTVTAAGANVNANATTVDAGCTPGGSDCARQITNTIRGNQARPLTVTFGAGAAPGSKFTFSSQLSTASGVTIEGVNQPVVLARSRNIARIGGLSNIGFQNFDIDLGGCGTTKNVLFAGPGEQFDNLSISNIGIFNGDAANGNGGSCVFLASRGSGTDIQLSNVTADRMRRVVWFNVVSDHRRVSIDNMNATEFGYQALSFDGYVEDLTIEDSAFARHARNVKGSHIIAFYPSDSETDVRSRNVTLRNSILEGWPDTPHIKIDGVTQPNGASGDLLALRGTDGFLLENNIFRHGGEVGITITAGAQNGIVRNNTVSTSDTTGIVLGNGNTVRVTNIDVYNNELFENSLDRDDSHRPLPALSLWGVTDSCVVHNNIYDNTEATGLWVWNGHLPPHWPRSVKNMYVTENTFSNNLYDFVQSSRPTRNFEPASSFGGINWTSTFGSPDRDGDGFGDVCSTETDDNDPCVPFAGAPACGGTPPVPPPPPPTPTPPTTAPPTTTPPTTTPPVTAPPTTDGPTPTTSSPTTPPSDFTCNGFEATIIGTNGDDVITGTGGRDVIVGLAGNDVILGLGGPDVICGGAGEDELRGGRQNDYISGGDGDDLIKGGRENDELDGGAGVDTMFGNNGRDTMTGGADNDIIRGNGGRDVLNGGPGLDYLAGNAGVDLLLGGDANDVLLGGSFNDELVAGSGQDECAGGPGSDTESECEGTPATIVDEYDGKIDDGHFD